MPAGSVLPFLSGAHFRSILTVAVYKANAFVLKRIPLGETDKILTLFTREYGKLSAVAKGSRKTTSRLAGATEPLMYLKALLAEGRNLDVLTQCEIRESFPLVRGDFGLYLRATYACELLDRVTVERHAHGAQEAFDLLLSTLYILQRARDPDAAVHAYELQLMAQEGYDPLLTHCVWCERSLDAEIEVVGYSAARGGALCADCAGRAHDEALPLGEEARSWMLRLAAEDNARSLAATEVPVAAREQLARVLREHLRFRLERAVRSTAFLDAYRLGAMDQLTDKESIPFESDPRP